MTRSARFAFCGAAVVLVCCLAACKKSGARSSKIICGGDCANYQRTELLPEQPPQGTLRLAIGGDSRDDVYGVVPWAFSSAKQRGAKAFFFLGDLELTPSDDQLFLRKLSNLQLVPFYPVMGNHEIETFGFLRLWRRESLHRVKEFKERYVRAPGVVFAPIEDAAVYSVDLEAGVHLIAMDNVSRKGQGFGRQQLDWVTDDLKAAYAAHKTIIVGMHKGLARNPVTIHAMDEDGQGAIADSVAALTLFKAYRVALVVVSHSHMYSSYNQDGIEVRLTGGMGAPLVKGLAEAEGGFHHFLLVDVPAGDNSSHLRVEVVKFQGPAARSETDESEEVE